MGRFASGLKKEGRKKMSEYKIQIVVAAGGPAGLAAAVAAAEKGAHVAVLEKRAIPGGLANSGMGILAIESHYQKEANIDLTVEKAVNMMMEYTHYNIDGRLVRRYFGQSADTIEWLEGMGVEFEGAFPYFSKSEATWHIVKTGKKIGPAAARVMNQKLAARAEELGVNIYYECVGKKVLKDADGKISGLLATDKIGQNFVIDCDAVIIACGGASGNPQLIYEETGFRYGEDLFNFSSPAITGDGLKMAWDAGADRLPVRIEQAALCGGLDTLPSCVPNVMMQPNLLVNLSGKRVMNEEQMENTTFLGNAAAIQEKRVLFSIVDSSIAEYYGQNGIDKKSLVRNDPDVSSFPQSVDAALKRGNRSVFRADTLKELAAMTGIDEEGLQRTIEQYNRFCESETGDEEFFKPKEYLRPIRKAPFYAATIYPGGYGTVGGIRINENCQVLSNFRPIPGLYAAGADACNLYNDSYMFLLPGNSMGFAVNSGRIAGAEAADYVLSLA